MLYFSHSFTELPIKLLGAPPRDGSPLLCSTFLSVTVVFPVDVYCIDRLLAHAHIHVIYTIHTVNDYMFVCLSQTTQGVQVNCFRTLEDLVLGYQHPHKGLVTPLLYGVPRDTDTGDESSGGPSSCHHNKTYIIK